MSSSKTSRALADATSAMESGAWIPRIAAVRPSSPRREASGSRGSANSPARSSASAHARESSQLVSPAFGDAG